MLIYNTAAADDIYLFIFFFFVFSDKILELVISVSV